jgi:ubiquinone/menaquinone biosynthesis C-methylase UbiE
MTADPENRRPNILLAKQKDQTWSISYRIGNSSATGFEHNTFDRVLIVLALHEMPRNLRLSALREAARVCRPGGRVIAVEHASPAKQLGLCEDGDPSGSLSSSETIWRI